MPLSFGSFVSPRKKEEEFRFRRLGGVLRACPPFCLLGWDFSYGFIRISPSICKRLLEEVQSVKINSNIIVRNQNNHKA